jgi:predicted nucleic acid-binding Zn ribbon protein
MRKDEGRSLADILKLFIQKNRLEKGLVEAEVNRLWPEVMGSGVAHYTQKVQLKGSVLHVHLSSTVLTKTAHDLKNEKPILFRHFHRYLNREWRSLL